MKAETNTQNKNNMHNSTYNNPHKVTNIICAAVGILFLVGVAIFVIAKVNKDDKGNAIDVISVDEIQSEAENLPVNNTILVDDNIQVNDNIPVNDSISVDDNISEDDPQFSVQTNSDNSSDANTDNADVNTDNTSLDDTAKPGETDSSDRSISRVKSLLSSDDASENSNASYGIDVAKYQGTIDWKKVAASGVQFAIVRVGYRTSSEGKITADSNARFNMQEASANGIKLGAYFFSTAVSEAEAIEEADWVADYISQYRITYPVAYNCEGYDKPDSRQFSLTKSQRTSIAKAFLDEIYKRGYTPMFYAAKSELSDSTAWDTASLDSSYKMWIAFYPGDGYDLSAGPGYSRSFNMWQYTSKGKIDGISKNVDINIANFGYDNSANAKDETAPETVSADVEALMNFREVNETVTAKNKTNLRDIPSQGDDSTVLATLVNPDTAERTGISNSGWSRLKYGDLTCYAVSSYLTTDTSAPAQETSTEKSEEPDNPIKTKFTNCDDTITAKQEVNLRTMPSVTNEQSLVVYTLHNGETAHRTGFNQEYGWSRLDINGQTLYCISSYIYTVQ